MYRKITDTQSLKTLIEAEKAILVYFYNDDCSPCMSLRPKVEQMREDHFPGMELVYVDSKSHPDIPASFGVFSNPVILVFFEAKEYIRKSLYIQNS